MKKILLLILLSGLTSVIANDLKLFEAGKKAFSVGLYSIAIENFNLYIESDDVDKKIDAIYLSGICSYYLKDYNKSLSYLEGIDTSFPGSVYIKESLYWIALNYYYLNNYEEAIVRFSRNIEESSKYQDISLLFLSLSQLQVDDKAGAINSLNKVINSDNSINRYKEEALYRLATLYLESDEINNSINVLNRLVFDFPKSKYYTESLELLADTYFLLEEWDSADRVYRLLLDEDQENKLLLKRLSSISWNLGDIVQSRDLINRYLKVSPGDKSMMFMLGDVLTQLKQYKEAINIYKRVEDLSGLTEVEKKENQYRLGTLFYRIEQFDMSYQYFSLVNNKDALYFTILSGLKSDKVVLPYIKKINSDYKSDKLSIDVINRYINYLDDNNNASLLEELLLYSTKHYPENLTYALTYGELLLEQNRLDESLKYLSRGYYEGSKYYSNITYKIGWIYYSKGEFSRAISYFDKLETTDDEYLKSLYSKSIANYQLGHYYEGKQGFLTLLEFDTEYNQEISFYLGMIEKNNYNYEKAISYFVTSMNKKELYNESLENIAWCNYHLKEYNDSLKYYLELYQLKNDNLYIFNAANCYYLLEDYDKAIKIYSELTILDNDLKSSSYHKLIELLFMLERDDEAYIWLSQFYNDFPNSDQPGDLILTIGDTRLYEGEIDKSIELFNKVMNIFTVDKQWYKARYRLAEAFRFKGLNSESISLYINSIIENDSYSIESTNHIVSILSDNLDPELTKQTMTQLDSRLNQKYRAIPIYTEFIRQNINAPDSLGYIEELISISRVRVEIDTLIYLKSLNLYNSKKLTEAEDNLSLLLSRPEVAEVVKIDSIFLEAQILEDRDQIKDAIDLYLQLYVNYPDNIYKASLSLYKAFMLAEKIGDGDTSEKVIRIINIEFKDSFWGKRALADE